MMLWSFVVFAAVFSSVTLFGSPVVAITEHPPTPATLKSLRHMTFAFSFDSRSKIDSHTSGFDRGDMSQGGGVAGPSLGGGVTGGAFGSGSMGSEISGSASSDGPTTIANGTIAIDVMTATGDGGLVVDVSENATKRSPVVRVGITDRALFYGPDAALTDEELTILHYLARDLVRADTLSAGTTWADDMAQRAGDTNRMRYTVTSVDEAAKTMNVNLAGSTVGTGPNGFTSTSSGTMVYNLGTLVPLRLSLATRSVLDKAGNVVTIFSQLTSTLQSDTFKKSS